MVTFFIKLLSLTFLKKFFAVQRGQGFSIYCSKSCKVLPFTFKSTIYPAFIFMCGMRKRTNIILHTQIIKHPRATYFPSDLQCHLGSLSDFPLCWPKFQQPMCLSCINITLSQLSRYYERVWISVREYPPTKFFFFRFFPTLTLFLLFLLLYQ